MSAASGLSDAADISMAAWCDEIARWALPEVTAPLIATGLQADTARRLLRSPRLSGRASALLAARLGRGEPDILVEADRRLVLASPHTLDRVAILAGTVWHAPRVRALVLAQDIEMFVAALGEDARDAALRHAALAPAPTAGGVIPTDGLEAAIRGDGAACLSAWIDVLPDWASSRMRLRWTAPDVGADGRPNRLSDDPSLRARAAGIVRAVSP